MVRRGGACKIEPLSLEVRQVRPADVRSIWPVVGPMIDKALRCGQGDESSSEYVLARIEAGLAQLWIVGDIQAVCVVSVIETDAARKLNVDVLTGKGMHRWEDQLEALLLEFRDITGSKCIEASCRRGLAKRLKKRGWREKAIVMELQ